MLVEEAHYMRKNVVGECLSQNHHRRLYLDYWSGGAGWLSRKQKTAFLLASALFDGLWLRVDERPHYIGVVRLGECIESLELPSAPLEVAGAEALFLASKNIAREQHLRSVMPEAWWDGPAN